MNKLESFLPKDKQTDDPLWELKGKSYVIEVGGAVITIPQLRKNAKRVQISLLNGPIIESSFEGIVPTCRRLVQARKQAGDYKVRQVTIDTPDKGKLFISEPGVGFKWV